ncbi:LexA family protein [Acinetobacter sp. ABJ_C1_1]|uniref:LexA family protein n=1 Tax=Acinetobacter sp. ABJ_C1_1 TaxID=3378321 RepID=UPI0037DCC1A2
MNTLQERISAAFSYAKQKDKTVTKTNLAAAAQVSRQAVSQWFTGTTKSLDSSTLLRVASYLGVRPEWLDGQGGSMVFIADGTTTNVSEIGSRMLNVPIISWVQAGDWKNGQLESLGRSEYQMVLSIFDTGKNGYALRVEGESMSPDYRQGDIIYVNPDKVPEHGMRVIASTPIGVTFKELVIEDGISRLKALNPEWQPKYLPCEDGCYILGVVVGTVRPEKH